MPKKCQPLTIPQRMYALETAVMKLDRFSKAPRGTINFSHLEALELHAFMQPLFDEPATVDG